MFFKESLGSGMRVLPLLMIMALVGAHLPLSEVSLKASLKALTAFRLIFA